jgi:hypothetical protein
LEDEITRLKEEIRKSQAEKIKATPIIVQKAVHDETVGTTQYAKISPLSTVANVFSGVVKNESGVGIENIIVIIKNAREEAVRALKTNSLGQFALITPLSNGKYKIEIDPGHKSGLSFDIIFAEAKGDVIPPLEFIGK